MYFSTWATAFPNWICGGIGVRKHSESLRDWSVSTCCLQECEYLIGVTISSPPSAKNPHSFQRACHHVTYFKAVFNCSIFSELVPKAEGENPYPKGALNLHHLRNLDLRGVRSIRNDWWLDVSMMLFWQCLAHFPANMSMGKAICSMGSPPEFRRFIYSYIFLYRFAMGLFSMMAWFLTTQPKASHRKIQLIPFARLYRLIRWYLYEHSHHSPLHRSYGNNKSHEDSMRETGSANLKTWGPHEIYCFHVFSIGWQSDRNIHNILQRTQAEPSMFFLRSLV